MSAQPMRKRPSSFTTYTEVEVDIDASDLEAEGWVYVGKDKGPTSKQVIDLVRDWHDLGHDGPWRWCDHDLCDSVRGREHG